MPVCASKFPNKKILTNKNNRHYYLGFALMLQQRYSDAQAVFGKCLYFCQKVGRYSALAQLYDSQNRMLEKMWILLALCTVLAPDNYHVKLEESILDTLQNKYGTEMGKLRKFEEGEAILPSRKDSSSKSSEEEGRERSIFLGV